MYYIQNIILGWYDHSRMDISFVYAHN